MGNIWKPFRVILIILAIGLLFAGLLFALDGKQTALLYLIAGMIVTAFERMVELA